MLTKGVHFNDSQQDEQNYYHELIEEGQQIGIHIHLDGSYTVFDELKFFISDPLKKNEIINKANKLTGFSCAPITDFTETYFDDPDFDKGFYITKFDTSGVMLNSLGHGPTNEIMSKAASIARKARLEVKQSGCALYFINKEEKGQEISKETLIDIIAKIDNIQVHLSKNDLARLMKDKNREKFQSLIDYIKKLEKTRGEKVEYITYKELKSILGNSLDMKYMQVEIKNIDPDLLMLILFQLKTDIPNKTVYQDVIKNTWQDLAGTGQNIFLKEPEIIENQNLMRVEGNYIPRKNPYSVQQLTKHAEIIKRFIEEYITTVLKQKIPLKKSHQEYLFIENPDGTYNIIIADPSANKTEDILTNAGQIEIEDKIKKRYMMCTKSNGKIIYQFSPTKILEEFMLNQFLIMPQMQGLKLRLLNIHEEESKTIAANLTKGAYYSENNKTYSGIFLKNSLVAVLEISNTQNDQIALDNLLQDMDFKNELILLARALKINRLKHDRTRSLLDPSGITDLFYINSLNYIARNIEAQMRNGNEINLLALNESFIKEHGVETEDLFKSYLHSNIFAGREGGDEVKEIYVKDGIVYLVFKDGAGIGTLNSLHGEIKTDFIMGKTITDFYSELAKLLKENISIEESVNLANQASASRNISRDFNAKKPYRNKQGADTLTLLINGKPLQIQSGNHGQTDNAIKYFEMLIKIFGENTQVVKSNGTSITLKEYLKLVKDNNSAELIKWNSTVEDVIKIYNPFIQDIQKIDRRKHPELIIPHAKEIVSAAKLREQYDVHKNQQDPAESIFNFFDKRIRTGRDYFSFVITLVKYTKKFSIIPIDKIFSALDIALTNNQELIKEKGRKQPEDIVKLYPDYVLDEEEISLIE